MSWEIREGDALQTLRAMPSDSVDCVVTSPPYWGLRDYGVEGQMGLEESPEAFVDGMVAVFREVRRVLKPTGTCWVNLGDSYCTRPNGPVGAPTLEGSLAPHAETRRTHALRSFRRDRADVEGQKYRGASGLKHKDLVGIPWMVAFALRADGWWLRSDIIWHKPNPMPESVTDRPTKSHEYLFLLTKAERYFYDADAVREPYSEASLSRYSYELMGTAPTCRQGDGDVSRREKEKGILEPNPKGRNRRTVWTIPTEAFKEAHFATYPMKLVEPCILAGCPRGGVVLDPFAGSGTTGCVALLHGRNFIGIELNPEYAAMARRRIHEYDTEGGPLFKEAL